MTVGAAVSVLTTMLCVTVGAAVPLAAGGVQVAPAWFRYPAAIALETLPSQPPATVGAGMVALALAARALKLLMLFSGFAAGALMTPTIPAWQCRPWAQ